MTKTRVSVKTVFQGKGSTATFCETLLRHQGKKVGLYTSPHLVSPCERIRIDGKPISGDEFEKYYFEIAQDLDDQVKLSFNHKRTKTL